MIIAICIAFFVGFVGGFFLMSLANIGKDIAETDTQAKLRAAAWGVQAIRPSNWDDNEDPEQAAAWHALESPLRAPRP